MPTTSNPSRSNFLGSLFLTLLAILYCLPALTAPYWGDNDGWSNLLPVIHYRVSILDEHTLPLFTNLWYGGRTQWQNPLWNFLYFPATLIWLVASLAWGTRIVLAGHLIFSLLAAKKLASLFLDNEISRICAAVVLVSPMLPSLLAVHFEKILGWGWILLSIYFLLNERYPLLRRGFYSGLCWGVVALAGDNYHVLYLGILLFPLASSFKKKKLLLSLLGGASIGLLHLPGVWYLVGQARSNPIESIPLWSMNLLGVFTSLTTGFASPISWETMALIGVPVFYLFLRSLYLDLLKLCGGHPDEYRRQKAALLLSLVILTLMAIGFLYKGHHLLDTFRVPARAISLTATIVTLYGMISLKGVSRQQKFRPGLFWIASALQIALFSIYVIQPTGSQHSPYDPQARQLAGFLKAENASSVWISGAHLSDMYIDVALTQNGISLPNAYYGDMGQDVTVNGAHCGYSFDYLISLSENNGGATIELESAISSRALASMPLNDLQHIKRVTLNSKSYDIFRVVCDLE